MTFKQTINEVMTTINGQMLPCARREQNPRVLYKIYIMKMANDEMFKTRVSKQFHLYAIAQCINIMSS